MPTNASMSLLAAAILSAACSSNPGQVAPGRTDTGESIVVQVQNNSAVHAGIGFSYHRDVPISLGRVEAGAEQSWTVGWQDLALRIEVERSGEPPTYSVPLEPAANDTVLLVLRNPSGMTASIKND